MKQLKTHSIQNRVPLTLRYGRACGRPPKKLWNFSAKSCFNIDIFYCKWIAHFFKNGLKFCLMSFVGLEMRLSVLGWCGVPVSGDIDFGLIASVGRAEWSSVWCREYPLRGPLLNVLRRLGNETVSVGLTWGDGVGRHWFWVDCQCRKGKMVQCLVLEIPPSWALYYPLWKSALNICNHTFYVQAP